jgi:hypothetical protein
LNNHYTIDPSGLIIAVGPAWDRYALEHDAPGAVSKHILGRKWWEFVSGQQTRSYLNAVFFACRMDHQEFSTHCRCDAPDEKAMYRFTVIPQEDETLVVDFNYIDDTEGSNVTPIDALADRVDTIRCSICCSFLLGENWIDPYFQSDIRFFAQSYSVCPNCRTRALAKIQNNADEHDLTARLIPYDKPPTGPETG